MTTLYKQVCKNTVKIVEQGLKNKNMKNKTLNQTIDELLGIGINRIKPQAEHELEEITKHYYGALHAWYEKYVEGVNPEAHLIYLMATLMTQIVTLNDRGEVYLPITGGLLREVKEGLDKQLKVCRGE